MPVDISSFATKNPKARFFMYTNHRNIKAPGWEVVQKNFEYSRFITHSRWPKFQGWKDDRLQGCQAVFYADAYYHPAVNGDVFRSLAREIRFSKSGLAQDRHDQDKGGGPQEEFRRIAASKKDISKNIDASMTWMRAQSTFNSSSTVYKNTVIGYDPTNIRYQEASNAFWRRYSMEKDSWRDQPLWAHVLDKHKLVPISVNILKKFVGVSGSRGNHQYSKSNENDAYGGSKLA